MMKKYFRFVLFRKCENNYILYIFYCAGIHHIYSNIAAMQISEMYTIYPYSVCVWWTGIIKSPHASFKYIILAKL